MSYNHLGESCKIEIYKFLSLSLPQSGIVHVSVDCEDMQFGCVSPHSVSDGKVRDRERSTHVRVHIQNTKLCMSTYNVYVSVCV